MVLEVSPAVFECVLIKSCFVNSYDSMIGIEAMSVTLLAWSILLSYIIWVTQQGSVLSVPAKLATHA